MDKMMNGCLSYSSELHILEHKLRVSNLKKEAISLYTHALIKISLLPRSKPRFFSFTETRDGYTIIVEDDLCKELPHTESIDMPDLVWRVLSVSAGAYGNNQLTGISRIVKTVITPLADCKVSVLVISTYQSDFVLVKEVDLDMAIKCLACNYKIFKDSGSGLEPVTLSIGDRMDGMGWMGMIERKADEHRPIVHPFTCAKNRFHVTSLDCRILPSLTSILIDLMFYSNSPDDQGCESFFHLSIVEGDISLVLDSEALSRFPEGSLYTNTFDEGWKMIRVGDTPLGFDEFGVAAQIAEPLADVQMSTYYISTYGLGHTLESGIVAQLSEPLTGVSTRTFYICTFFYDHLLIFINIRELKHATFLSHGWQPEVCCFLRGYLHETGKNSDRYEFRSVPESEVEKATELLSSLKVR